MHLHSFRVQNYKKVADTGWVTVHDLTILVGKNESGKSAIFRGLSKLNPSDLENYDPLKEFPRRRYTDEFKSQDWPVASGRFEPNEKECAALASFLPALKGVKTIEITRHYSSKLDVTFSPALSLTVVTATSLHSAIETAVEAVQDAVAPDGRGEAFGALKTAITTSLEQAKNSVADGTVNLEGPAQAAVVAITSHLNEEWLRPLLAPALTPLKVLVAQIADEKKLREARAWVLKSMPRFLYFDHYDVLESAIHIPSFLTQVNNTPNAPRVRTTQCLFKHVNLDLPALSRLGQHQLGQPENEETRRQIDERGILTSSAAQAMTEKFRNWWEQRRHEFDYHIDGDYFRVLVKDDLDPSPIDLDQRSAGMQYFFSFYLVFLVESGAAHENTILLLDEPGNSLHGTAQEKLVRFLRKLSADNQVLYSTHSPFMIDVDHLEDTRAVYEERDGTTRVSEDVWPRDKEALFPLQAALGYRLAQGLFISKRQLIVEGLTDLWLLKAMDIVMDGRKRTRLRPDIVIVPGAGVNNVVPLASMLMGHNVEVCVLLDGDEPGRRVGKKLVADLLGAAGGICLFIGDFADRSDAELEDLFPEDEYLLAVQEAYPEVEFVFTSEEGGLSGAVARVEALFKRLGLGRFEKWRPAGVLRDRIVAKPEAISEKTITAFEQVFTSVNAAISVAT